MYVVVQPISQGASPDGVLPLPHVVLPREQVVRLRQQERSNRMYAFAVLGSAALSVGGLVLSTLGYQRESAALTIGGITIGGIVTAVKILSDA